MEEDYKRVEPTNLLPEKDKIIPSNHSQDNLVSKAFVQKLLVDPYATKQIHSELKEEKSRDLSKHPFLVDLFGTQPVQSSVDSAIDDDKNIQISPSGKKFGTLTNRRRRIVESLGRENITKVRIPKHHVGEKVVLYEVEVSSKSFIWNMWLRFEEFHKLHSQLLSLAAEYDTKFGSAVGGKYRLPPFPFKQPKLIIDHKSDKFISERRSLLENYLQRILVSEGFNNYEAFVTFLLPPKNEYEVPAKKSSESPVSVRLSKTKSDRSRALEISGQDEITGISITKSKTLENHTLYHVDLENENKPKSHASWTVLKRYGDVFKFDATLRSEIATKYPECLKLMPTFPPRSSKIFTNHADPVFIERRRVLLNNYCQDLIKYPVFRRHQVTIDFFT
jgi:hypothetical protein